MFTAFIDTFHWWWLLVIPVVVLLLAGCYRLLTRIEWLRNRRLTICVALSVLAHALLLTGAYMAKLFDAPDLAGDGSIRVTWEESTDDNPVPTHSPLPFPAPDARTVPLNSNESGADPRGFETPRFETPDFEPVASELPEFEPLASVETAPDKTQVGDASSLFEPADRVVEPKALSDLDPPRSPEPATPQTEPRPATPNLETPAFKIPLADEPLLTSDADATHSLEDRQPDIQPSTLADPPSPSVDLVTRQPSDPWSPSQNVASIDPTSQDSSNALVPVRRMRPSTSSAPVDRYQLRSVPDRMEYVRKRGGDADTEAAVAAAQQWLAANQELDGHWDASRHQSGQDRVVDGNYRGGAGREADTGITGLALLCFLGNGNTHTRGEYRSHVGKAMEYLMGQQSEDGNLAGNSLAYARTYCHGIATLALSEAYAMTSDERLRPFVQRAVNYTLRTQQAATGGWRYRPGQSGDMSQFGWQVMALVSADQAGIPLPSRDRHLLTTFLRTVSTGQFGGLASYRPHQRPSATMTAEALVCRVFLGETSDRSRLAEAADYIARQPPSTGPMNLYYWYYGTIAMYQYGDPHWEIWNAGIKRRLLGSQQASGSLAGSWDPNTVWGSYGGRVYSTAMAALCLEVYYRFLPLLSDRTIASRP